MNFIYISLKTQTSFLKEVFIDLLLILSKFVNFYELNSFLLVCILRLLFLYAEKINSNSLDSWKFGEEKEFTTNYHSLAMNFLNLDPKSVLNSSLLHKTLHFLLDHHKINIQHFYLTFEMSLTYSNNFYFSSRFIFYFKKFTFFYFQN